MFWHVLLLIFQALEDFLWQAADLLDRLDDLQEDLSRGDLAEDLAGAKTALELHNEMKKKILKAPVEDVDLVGQRLLQRYLPIIFFIFFELIFEWFPGCRVKGDQVVMTRATRGGTPRRAQARPTLTCRPVCLKFCSTWRLRERLSSNCCHCGLTKRRVWTSVFSSDCLSKTAIRCVRNFWKKK